MRETRFFRAAALAALVIATAPPPANAVDKCKVRVDGKTGVLRVDATGVSGPLTWGGESGQATS